MPTLPPSTDPSVARAISDLTMAYNALDRRIKAIEQSIANRPTPLTLKEIQQGLSANGAAPLNVTGLVGALPSLVIGP
jgi:hypothetical protein